MKGVILAGGTGTRLHELTGGGNKHLLEVHDRPMVHYPIETLIGSGITEILVIVSADDEHAFQAMFDEGSWDADLSLDVQDRPLGIAHALGHAENFAAGEGVAVILGDNIFERPLNIGGFENGARVFLKDVADPERFGIAIMREGKIESIDEKPDAPTSRYAVTGAYLYDERVFDIIRNLEFSHRGELEITDVNNEYIRLGAMEWEMILGFWVDAGTMETYMAAVEHIRGRR